MNWRLILSIVVFLVSVAGIFYAGYQLARILEKIFHIHLM